MGMNNLLGPGTEFVCSDGRMSINGICRTPEQAIQPVQPVTASPVQDSDDNTNNYEYDKNVKSTFEWDFDKVGNKVENFGTTIKDNVTAYNEYIGDKLGISSNAIGANRAVGSAATIFSGGSLIQAAGPWGLAFGIGSMIKGKDKPEVIDTMSFKKTPPVTYTDNSSSGPGETTQGTFGSSVNEATGSRGSGTGFSDYS